MATRSIFATFIGIDAYAQNPLYGCIKDVLNMDLLVREQAAQQEGLEYKPLYFLAPDAMDRSRIKEYAAEKKIDLKYKLPTFRTVTEKAFAHLKKARTGDICLLYYSGHGSQIDAPEVFWHTKPDRQNETIVCMDSRDQGNADSRDIIDKELAFLLWDALQGKEVHCLVIMDCCHSGNNTRESMDGNIQFRYMPSSKNQVPLEKYLGFDQGFYKIDSNGRASIKIARYVHIAAARDSEKALEMGNGGLFTSKLAEALRMGGTDKSYRELVQGLSITIRNRAIEQNPVAYSENDSDLDLRFLGNGIKPYQPSYEVRYDFTGKRWIMYGGSMHNIFPSSQSEKTLIKIAGAADTIEIKEVSPTTSVLDSKTMSGFDKGREDLQAIIVRRADPPVKIGLSGKLWSEPRLLSSLREAYRRGNHLFFDIDFENKNEKADYYIHLTEDNAYILIRPGSGMPLFKREIVAGNFLRNADAVSKWISVSELQNADTEFSKKDFVFTLEKIEGKSFTADNIADWGKYKGQITNLIPGNEMVFSYQEENQPAFRLSIGLKTATVESCYIGALYMNSQFGIVHDLIAADKGRLVKDGSPVDLTWTFNGQEYRTILLQFDKAFSKYNINEITEYLKIFVSTEPVTLERYKQKSLDMPEGRQNRGMGLDNSNSDEEKTDWTVFTFPFRIIGPGEEKKSEGGIPGHKKKQRDLV
jgi:hypothetical protein